MTKFTSLEKKEKKVGTKFYSFLYDNVKETTDTTPCDYDNVLHIGFDTKYGDVFKCWDDDSGEFSLYFGIKGNEFDQIMTITKEKYDFIGFAFGVYDKLIYFQIYKYMIKLEW